MIIIYGVYEKFVSGWAGNAEGWELSTLHTTEDLARNMMQELENTALGYKYKVKEVFVNE